MGAAAGRGAEAGAARPAPSTPSAPRRVPAAAAALGEAHWEVLLRARAIENQAYVVASAQGGVHENGRKTWGQSMVIDPWGTVLGQHATGPGVVVCDVDPAQLQAVRSQLPALEHRRF